MPLPNPSWRRYLSIVLPVFAVAALAAVFVPEARRLAALFFYSIPANSFIPVPHEVGMIYFGQFYHPAVVAVVAAAGTVIACFIDYEVISRAFRTRSLQKVRSSDVYCGAIHYFLKAPFLTVTVAAALPFIPFYVFRVLSTTAGYSLRRYTAAVFVGRLPRYYVFALMGNALTGADLWISLGLIVAACLLLSRRVKQHLSGKASPEASDATPAARPEPVPEEQYALD